MANTLGGLDQVTRSLTNLEDPEAPPQIDQFQFDHDGLGRRISKKINGQIIRHYILDEQNRLVAEALPDGKITTEYVYGTLSHSPDYIIRGGVKYKLVHDQLGSVRLVVNSNRGEIVSKVNYDEFGRATERLRPGFQSIGYAGGIRVGINGLYRFGARDYDPSIGRWTAKDPILFNGGDTNLYGYVLGDPVNWIDPNGLYNSAPGPNTNAGGHGPTGAIDINLTIGFGGGVNVGVQISRSTGLVYPYGGFGLTTPPGGASLSYCPNEPSPGNAINISGGAGPGISGGAQDGNFTGGAGVTTPGASMMFNHIFPGR